MTDAAIDPEALDADELVRLVDQLDADAINALVRGLDTETINKLVAAVEPETARKLIRSVDPGSFDLSTIEAGLVDPTLFDTDLVALVVRITPEAKLHEAMEGELRDVIVPEVFRRMPERLKRPAADNVEAVIEWKVSRNGGEPDRFVVVIDKGTCGVASDFSGTPTAPWRWGPWSSCGSSRAAPIPWRCSCRESSASRAT